MILIWDYLQIRISFSSGVDRVRDGIAFCTWAFYISFLYPRSNQYTNTKFHVNTYKQGNLSIIQDLSTGVRILETKKIEKIFYQTNNKIIHTGASKLERTLSPLLVEEAKVWTGGIELPPAAPGMVEVPPPPEVTKSPLLVGRTWVRSDIDRVQNGTITVTVVVIVDGLAITAARAGLGLVFKSKSAARSHTTRWQELLSGHCHGHCRHGYDGREKMVDWRVGQVCTLSCYVSCGCIWECCCDCHGKY